MAIDVELKTLKQNNTSWPLTFKASNRFPIVANRVFATLEKAQQYIDDTAADASAYPGIVLAVVQDTIAKNNGVYYVQSVAMAEGETGTLVKVGGTETETATTYSVAVTLSQTLVTGQLIKVASEETVGDNTYKAGFYIVETPGTISALDTSTGAADEVGALKTRVDALEANKADLTGLTALTKTVNDNYNTYDAHAKDAFIHITQDERTNWNHAHEWSSGNTIDISNLKSVVSTKADASALTNYLTTEQAGINDETVRGLITAETKARVDAISALTEVVDAKAAQSDLNSLSETVETNYNTLNGLITAETEARVNAITSLTEVVDTKVSNDEFTAHTTNGNIHITAEERTKWNEVVTNFNTFITGDTEAALNTLVDLQQWIESHGDDAQAMTTAITANLESITALTQTVGVISGKVDNNITAITKNTKDIATKAAQSDLEALAIIVGNETNNSGIFEKLSELAGDVANKLTKSATVNGKSFSEDGALVIDSADINLKEGFGKKLVNEEEIDRYTTGNTIQYVLKDIDTRIDAINTTIDNVTGGGVIADITEGDGISVDKSSKTTPTVSVNTDNSSVTINSNKEISVKLSTSENNALYVDKNGLFVQAITIEGDDIEGENSQA